MWKSVVEPDRPQMAIKYSACALHAGYLKLQTHTQNMQYLLLFHDNNGYETCLNVTLHIHCLFCFKNYPSIWSWMFQSTQQHTALVLRDTGYESQQKLCEFFSSGFFGLVGTGSFLALTERQLNEHFDSPLSSTEINQDFCRTWLHRAFRVLHSLKVNL